MGDISKLYWYDYQIVLNLQPVHLFPYHVSLLTARLMLPLGNQCGLANIPALYHERHLLLVLLRILEEHSMQIGPFLVIKLPSISPLVLLQTDGYMTEEIIAYTFKLSIGFSYGPQMGNSDCVTGWVTDSGGEAILMDTWSPSTNQPLLDTADGGTNDITATSGTQVFVCME